MNLVRLYKKHAGSVGSWHIWSEVDKIYIEHCTVMGGSPVQHVETVQVNQSGRTLPEQIQLRINSRVSRMLDKGYKATIQEAMESQGNQLGLDRPMLAQTIEKVSNVDFTRAVLQKKLDGHRCLITCRDGELIAYTRQGKAITTLDHIVQPLCGRIPEGTTIDGELYCHGFKLQTLGSWIKRKQTDTLRLYFVAYDLISKDDYIDRHRELSELLEGVDTRAPGKIVALPYQNYQDSSHTAELLSKVRSAGFEGLMLRTRNRGYEAGKRSSGLLKIKKFLDTEVRVVGFEQSKTGWAICTCLTKDFKTVRVSAPGSVDEKTEVWHNRAKYLNRWLTIEFAHWTDDGIPFQPTAIRWREDI